MANELNHNRVELQEIKIKSIAMQTARIVQAVIILMIVAAAAGCAASKEYSSKLFSPRNEPVKDSPSTALRFLELENLQSEKEDWVTTDIIMGRDTVSKTAALDKLAKTFPAIPAAMDTAATGQKDNTTPIIAETKPIAGADLPVARNYNPGEVRNKRTREK